MSFENHPKRNHQAEEVRSLAEQPAQGLVAEFLDFLAHNKRWWLAPIFVVILLVGLLIWACGSAVTPFIYPL